MSLHTMSLYILERSDLFLQPRIENARPQRMQGISYIYLYIFSCTNREHISRHTYLGVGLCIYQSTKDY